jgi:hypothetical protein
MIAFNRSLYTPSKRSSRATGIKGRGPATRIMLELIEVIMHCTPLGSQNFLYVAELYT